MKTTVLFLCFILLNSNSIFSQTQYDLNIQASNEFQKADSELNSINSAILDRFKKDIVFIKNYKKSQRIWKQFRDAEMDMKYPQYKDAPHGSSAQMCWGYYKTVLTTERIKKLKDWIEGIEEGDICRGSVPSSKD